MLKKVLTNAVLPILASFIIGAILISAIGASPEDVLSVIGDIFSDSNSIAEIFVSTIPLICTGLSVAFAFRTGLFNIGAEGQFIMGGLFAGLVAIKMEGMNFYLVLICSIRKSTCSVTIRIWFIPLGNDFNLTVYLSERSFSNSS